MSYRRLTLKDRYQIEGYLKSGLSLRAIAMHLGLSPSTISREINKGGKGCYTALVSEYKTLDRVLDRCRKRVKIKGHIRKVITQKLKLQWSPEQVSGWIKLNNLGSISHQTIYRFLVKDRNNGGLLWKELRILRKSRNKYNSIALTSRRNIFGKRLLIKDRPLIVEKRNRLGDYERDTVFGKANGSLLLVLVDRKSRFTKIEWAPKKSAELIHKATVRALRNEPVKTITNDNGAEFTYHKKTSEKLKAKIYFAHSFRSWERGTNENTIGLIRQYFPRETDIGSPTTAHLREIEKRINTRPRKCLAYKTPLEIHIQLKRSVLR